MNILRKFKKNKEIAMSSEELLKINNRLYELKDLMIKALNEKRYSDLEKYANEIKDLKKILKRAKRNAPNE